MCQLVINQGSVPHFKVPVIHLGIWLNIDLHLAWILHFNKLPDDVDTGGWSSTFCGLGLGQWLLNTELTLREWSKLQNTILHYLFFFLHLFNDKIIGEIWRCYKKKFEWTHLKIWEAQIHSTHFHLLSGQIKYK